MAAHQGACPTHGLVTGINATLARGRPVRTMDRSLRAQFRHPGGPLQRAGGQGPGGNRGGVQEES